MTSRILACALALHFIIPAESESAEADLAIYVDGTAGGVQDGTIEAPFRQLEQARDHLRNLRSLETEPTQRGYTVYLRAGVYPRTETFMLTPEDGGTVESQVTYCAFERETVVLSGGKTLRGSELGSIDDPAVLARIPEAVREQVRVLDFKETGLSMDDFGEIQYWQKGGLKYPTEQGAVWIDGIKMTLARYPKEGFVQTGEVLHTGSIPRHSEKKTPEGGVFKYTDDAVADWADHTNVWLYGYLKESYADGTVRIESVDREARTISVAQPSWYGIGEGGRYCYLNVLEHLSEPGECYLDAENGLLYVLPPGGFDEDTTVEVSLSESPIVEIEGADYVTISGIDCRLTRGDAIRVKDASHVTIEQLSIDNIEGNGILMPNEGAEHNEISRVTFESLGGFAFTIGGGDKKTQRFGQSVVENCRITNFGLNRSGKSQLRGVGNTVRHCEFSNCREGALSISGNDQRVEYSRFEYLNTEGSDAGAVYMGRNPSETGIQIRHNFFGEIGNELEGTGIQGVYVDDRSGFVEVIGNVFYRVGSGRHASAFKVNGGKYNTFVNNLVVEGRAAFFQVHDTTPEEWRGWYESAQIVDRLGEVDFPNPDSPWARRYPVAFAAATTPDIPDTTTNVIKDNLVVRGELVDGIIGGRYGDPKASEEGNRVIDFDPGFENLEGGDLRIPRRVMELEFPEFEWIDLERIGVGAWVEE